MLDGLGPRSLLAISAPTGLALRALERGRVHAAVVHGLTHALPAPPSRWCAGTSRAGRWGSPSPPGSRTIARSRCWPATSGRPTRPGAASQQAFERARLATGRQTPSRDPCDRTSRGRPHRRHPGRRRGHHRSRRAGVRPALPRPRRSRRRDSGSRERWRDHPGVNALAELLATTAFTERVAHFGGYDLAHCGEPAQTK